MSKILVDLLNTLKNMTTEEYIELLKDFNNVDYIEEDLSYILINN
jgi:hypothetical protein